MFYKSSVQNLPSCFIFGLPGMILAKDLDDDDEDDDEDLDD